MDLGASLDTTVHDTAEYDNSFVCIINRVKDQCFQRSVYISVWCRDLGYNLLQDFFYVEACFG